MKASNILQVADFGSIYSGNFIASLLRLQETVTEQLGLGMVFVLPKVAEERPWLKLVQERGIPALFIDKHMPLLKRFQAVTAIAKEYNAVLLHSHFTSFDMDAAVTAKRLGVKVVWHMHSGLTGKYIRKQRVKDLIKMRIISRRWVDRVLVVSDSVAQFARLRGASPSKIITIYNGIDMARLEAVDENVQATLRHRYDIAKNQRVFLLFGWDPVIKGVDLLAKATALLERSGYTDVICLVVSGKKNEVIISQMIGEISRVRVISPVENVAELYALADCFVSASRSEGLPYAIGEAMALGLPVVSSDLPHLIRIYGPSGEGFLTFRNGDAQDLAKILAQVLETSSEKLHRLGESNRYFIKENLAVDRWCQEMVDLYRSLLGLEGSK